MKKTVIKTMLFSSILGSVVAPAAAVFAEDTETPIVNQIDGETQNDNVTDNETQDNGNQDTGNTDTNGDVTPETDTNKNDGLQEGETTQEDGTTKENGLAINDTLKSEYDNVVTKYSESEEASEGVTLTAFAITNLKEVVNNGAEPVFATIYTANVLPSGTPVGTEYDVTKSDKFVNTIDAEGETSEYAGWVRVSMTDYVKFPDAALGAVSASPEENNISVYYADPSVLEELGLGEPPKANEAKEDDTNKATTRQAKDGGTTSGAGSASNQTSLPKTGATTGIFASVLGALTLGAVAIGLKRKK